MNEPENQVLEHALRELLSEKPTGLAERVLRAWRESPEGPDLTVESAEPTRGWRPALVAAAILLGLWLVVQRDLLRGGSPRDGDVVATADGELGVLGEGESLLRQRSAFRIGETLINGPDRESQVTVASAGSITMGRCSMLTIDRDAAGLLITPKLGRLTLTAESDVRVRTALGTIALPARGDLRVELLADGYTLEHPDRFQQLAMEIHMKTALPLILTCATLLEGSAWIESATSTGPMVIGETLQEPIQASAKAIKAKLLEEVGAWDLTVTDSSLPGETLQGEEICRAGPGGEWLISDLTVRRGERTITTHTVVGYESRKQSYTGSIVDNFGGEIGLIRGAPDPDPESRTLRMYSAHGTPGFDARWLMKWEGPSERRTRLEVLQGEEWVLVREFVHRRRE